MKKIIVLLLLAAVTCGGAAKNDYWMSFPGAMKKDQCAPYAEAVQTALEAQGVTSYKLVFDWRDNVGWSAWSGRHEVVIFRIDGVYYLISNEIANRPARRLKTGPFLRMIQQVYSSAYRFAPDF